jgi:hypothetical protein
LLLERSIFCATCFSFVFVLCAKGVFADGDAHASLIQSNMNLPAGFQANAMYNNKEDLHVNKSGNGPVLCDDVGAHEVTEMEAVAGARLPLALWR